MARAKAAGCEVVLPIDVVVADRLASDAIVQTVPVNAVPVDAKILDAGPATIRALVASVSGWRTVVWNGPLGAFETPPFDRATTALAQAIATATHVARFWNGWRVGRCRAWWYWNIDRKGRNVMNVNRSGPSLITRMSMIDKERHAGRHGHLR